MEDFPYVQVFTKGRAYRVIQKSSQDGYCVMDNEHEWNCIGVPGDDAFDEYFDNQSIQRTKADD